LYVSIEGFKMGEKSQKTPNHFNMKLLNGSRSTVNISKLKNFALKLPLGSPLRDILISEESKLSAQTFLARLPIYLKLCRLEENRRRHE